MNRSLIALSRYSLTQEDRRIFERWTDSHTQARYKTADVHALIRSAAALRAFGSICTFVIDMMHKPPRQRLDVLEISSWLTDSPFITSCWAACLREYDEGSKVFTGRTQREAIDEMLDYYEQDNGEMHA